MEMKLEQHNQHIYNGQKWKLDLLKNLNYFFFQNQNLYNFKFL